MIMACQTPRSRPRNLVSDPNGPYGPGNRILICDLRRQDIPSKEESLSILQIRLSCHTGAGGGLLIRLFGYRRRCKCSITLTH